MRQKMGETKSPQWWWGFLSDSWPSHAMLSASSQHHCDGSSPPWAGTPKTGAGNKPFLFEDLSSAVCHSVGKLE